jgi:hypothetical protein
MARHSHRFHYNIHGSWTAPLSGGVAPPAMVGLNVNALLSRYFVAARPAAQPVMSAANRTRQAVMREAWAIKREEPGATFANCLRTAWAIIKGLGE